MASSQRMQRWTVPVSLTLFMAATLWGCSSVPRRYVWIAEPGVTLTMLSMNPQPYVGKVVLLGGTITEEQQTDQFVLLRLKNRPLDQDYKPHRPANSASAEAGSYWVIVPKQQVPPKYRDWGGPPWSDVLPANSASTLSRCCCCCICEVGGRAAVTPGCGKTSIPIMCPQFRVAFI